MSQIYPQALSLVMVYHYLYSDCQIILGSLPGRRITIRIDSEGLLNMHELLIMGLDKKRRRYSWKTAQSIKI